MPLEDDRKVKHQRLEAITNSDVDKEDRNLSAVKADDAEVPEYLWDQALMSERESGRKGGLLNI